MLFGLTGANITLKLKKSKFSVNYFYKKNNMCRYALFLNDL
jgi:hypothetical protein